MLQSSKKLEFSGFQTNYHSSKTKVIESSMAEMVSASSVTSLNTKEITLGDLLVTRPSGLEEVETWAVLCQSVQALQDLFLSDGASGKQCIPLVTPALLILSSKGRVKLQFSNSYTGSAYLAPEYKLNKNYTDSEYEKIWIYSLGETLKRATVTSHIASSRLSSELCRVLSYMTRLQKSSRASLMYLLNVMSEYCKNKQQNRPFSHIVMDLHQEALAGLEASTDILWGPPAMPEIVPRATARQWHFLPKPTGASMEDLSVLTLQNTPGKVIRPKSMCVPDRRYNQRNDHELFGRNTLCVSRRNPIQRAASRLYSKSLVNKSDFVGPEFIIKSSLPPKQLVLAQNKGSKKPIIIILLDGQKLEVMCSPNNTTACQLMELIIQEQHIEENFMLGLSALIAGDFVFIPADTRICKVNNLTLYLRVRFFLPSLRGIKGSQARHLLYLQLRRSLLEHQLPSAFSQIIELNGLALQAEFGNYDEIEHGARDYFLLEHYIPETMTCIIDDEKRLRNQLIQAHKLKKGLDRGKAEEDFIGLAQNLSHYGGHFYTATWLLNDDTKKDVWLFISAQGVNLYERARTTISQIGPELYEMFEWKNIQTLCYTKHYLSVRTKFKKYKLKMEHKKSYFAFRLASVHHQFFLKLRTEYTSLQTLSNEFGIPLKDIKNNTNNSLYRRSKSVHDLSKIINLTIDEDLQNKENENPGPATEKRRGVKMGTRAFSKPSPRVSRSLEAVNDQEFLEKASLESVSLHCSSDGDAYVIDSTLKSFSHQNILPNFQETINETLLERLENISFAEERSIFAMTLYRDNNGSLGLQITEGSDGNVYILSVMDASKNIQKGDQVIAVNGQSLLGRKYCESLHLLKNTGKKVDFVLSRIVDVSKSPSIESQIEKHTLESCHDSSNNDKYNNDRAVIVEMIPKKVVPKYVKQDQVIAMPRSLGLSRKWKGPVKYPVTPVKKSASEGEAVSSSEEEQVFI